MASILLYLLEKNLPLSEWPNYQHIKAEESAPRFYSLGGPASSKEVHNQARALVNACANRLVVEQLAKELEDLPSILRVRFTQVVDDLRRKGSVSNNVSKGLGRLDELTGGKILARQTGPTERTLQVIGGRKVSVERRVNPAIAGATRLYSADARPANYDKLSKRERKQIDREISEARREVRRR